MNTTMRQLAATILVCTLGLTARVASGQADEGVAIDVVRPVVTPTPSRPRLEDVFQSLQSSTQGTASAPPLVPVVIALVASLLMAIALSQWKRRRTAKPRRVENHAKLLDELSRATGLSRRQLARLMPLSQSAGMCSPAVAAICPSVLRQLAQQAKTGHERSALGQLARQAVRDE